MPTPGLNGIGYHGTSLPEVAHAAMLARIEAVLQAMTAALMDYGFSEYEVSEINLNTRFAIAAIIKERARRQ